MCKVDHTKTKQSSKVHDKEHAYWSRRSFMQALGIVGSGSMMFKSNFISASTLSPLSAAIANAETDRILLIIKLSGGNDGLNTIIPINQFDAYANARPNISIPQNKILKLNDEYGLPDYMQDTRNMWAEGQFKVVHGVGYADQKLSHFTGSDIWSNTDLETEAFTGTENGWLGRHFDTIYPNYLLETPPSPAALQIGSFGDLVFQGSEIGYAFTTTNVAQLESIAQSGLQYQVSNELFDDCMYDDQLQFLRGVANTTYEYSGVINAAYESGKNEVEYSTSDFSRQLAIIARLIKGNLGTKVFMITMHGFDTHAGQAVAHQKLLSELSQAINKFYTDLSYSQMENKVLGMTISEFGRRIYENASKGTDHGKAAPMLFFGAGLNGSAFIGDHPDLQAPDNGGNLEYSTDFRDVYATVLAEWMCVPVPSVENYLLGHPYNPVQLGFSCSGSDSSGDGTDNSDPNNPGNNNEDPLNPPSIDDIFTTRPFYPSKKEPFINIQVKKSGLLDVQLYNVIGQKMGTIFNAMVFEDELNINVKEEIGSNLTFGLYIYRVTMKEGSVSKKIIIE